MVLEEGIAARAADIDVVWTSGYGFPRYRGGPMFYADTLGLPYVLERIRHYHETLGHYWRPAGLIERLAAEGASFALAFGRVGLVPDSGATRYVELND